MGGLIAKAIFKSGKDKLSSTYKSAWDIPVKTLEGKEVSRLGDLVEGKKAVLIVNVASKWGLTDKNYR